MDPDLSKSETSIPDVYVFFLRGVVNGDNGSMDGPAAAAVRGEVRLEDDGEGEDSSFWDNNRRARIKADLKCAGETEEAF